MDPTFTAGLGMHMNGLPNVNNTDDWKAPTFRQKIIQSIEDALRQSPNPIAKNSTELENHVFSRANSREQYLALVARLILHLREIKPHNQQQSQQQQLPPQQQQPPQQHAGGPSSGPPQDPINALQNMTQSSQGNILQMQRSRQDMGMMPQMPPQQRPSQYPPQAQNFQQPPGQPVNLYQTPVSPATNLQQFSPANVFVPPQSPQTMPGLAPSPATVTPRAAASPISNVNLNTPSGGNPPSVGLSPSSGAKQNQEQAYYEKLKQLQKYIDPLRRMINKIKKDPDRNKDGTTLSKLQNLLDVLSDSSKKLPMAALLKCEMALERMDLFTRPSSAATKPAEHHQMCQPLVDAVAQHSKSPMLNHTLNRTFGPALNALHGPPIRAPSPPAKRKKQDDSDDHGAVPDVIQGEIARLGRRFKVDLDPKFDGGKTLHLVCQLDDNNLPSVPPINIVVPENYPTNSPECSPLSGEYESSQFLSSVQEAMMSKMSRLSDKFSITALLNTWEMSVRQACRPPCENDVIRTQ